MLRSLIADDKVIERGVLRKALQKNVGGRCIIFQVKNGREALKIYEGEKIQMAVLGIETPGVSGVETAQQIRETNKECYIIFFTTYDEFNYAKKAIAVRTLDYLLEPYDEQKLMLVVKEAIHLTSEYQADKILKEKLAEPPMSAGEEAEDRGQIRLSKITETISLYIEENYRLDASMQDLARHIDYSETYLCRLFKQCFHKNFMAYLTEYRVEKAEGLLAQPTANVKDIGKTVGYGDPNYFTKVFKHITGQSSTEYRLCIS